MERMTLSRVGGQSRMSTSLATINEIDDEHLVQEVKKANGFYSETMTNEGSSFERFQMVGVTAVPLKQFEDEQQGQNKSGGQQSQTGFNDNQPKGKSADAVVMYVNGSRSHPVALVDDRRVRPYKMKEGDASLYHAAGTEQKVYISDDGVFLLANNNPTAVKGAQPKERFASLRHVSGEKQKRELKKGEQVPDHKHEGETVNLEVRCTSGRIEFRDGNDVVGYYDKAGKKWFFTGTDIEHVASNSIKTSSLKTSNTVAKRYETIGPTYLGLDEKDEEVPITDDFDTPAKQVFIKLA
jgi:phage gp45-like